MKRTFIIIMLAVAAIGAHAQLSLDSCRRAARQNYPAIRQYRLTEISRDLTVSNAAKAWLPQVSVTGTAAAFTDIMDKNQPAALAIDMKNSLYSAAMTVSQTLYDGGTVASQKSVARAQADVETSMTDVALYDVENRVEELYFGIMSLDAQLRQNDLLISDLRLGLKTVEDLERGGLANMSDIEAVKVEIVAARQQRAGIDEQSRAYRRMLGLFIGREVGDSTVLIAPVTTVEAGGRRPELDYYAGRLALIDVRKRQLDTRLLPRVSAFGMAAYHNRVMHMMHPGMLAAGVTLSWNIGALYTRKNDRLSLDNERDKTLTDRATFLFNLGMNDAETRGRIDGLKRRIKLDDEAVSLRESLRRLAEIKVKNGTETVNEMLRDINAVSQARQTKVLHEISLQREQCRLARIKGR